MTTDHRGKAVGDRIGNYRLVRLLGSGGFADVYLGEHQHLGTHAAIKVLHTKLLNEQVEQFRQEARILAHLVHPHIVRVLDFDVDNMFPFLVMDYAPGGTLRQRHPKGSMVPLLTVIDYVTDIASALDYAHSQKLIHRDVKPENMLLNQQGQIVLSDFGVASIAHNTRSQTLAEVAGTISYIAPEQIQGHPRLASDQYALGVVVYEWLNGERPFRGSFGEVASQHLLTPPPALYGRVPGISQAVENVIFTALAKDPRDRFATTQEFAVALARAGQQERIVIPTMSRFESVYPIVEINDEPTQPSSPADAQRKTPTPAVSSDVSPVYTPKFAPLSAISNGGISNGGATQPMGEIESSAPSVYTAVSPYSASQPIAPPPPMAQTARAEQPLSFITSQISSRAPRQNRLALGVIIVLVVLLIAGGAFYVFTWTGTTSITISDTREPIGKTAIAPSATTRASNVSATTTAIASSNATATATTIASNNATATVAARHAAIANATPERLYTLVTSGSPTLVDPLSGPNGNGWPNADGCVFKNGAYHAITATNGSYMPCTAGNTNFCNLAYQAQMTNLGGDGGGLIIRSTNANGDRVRIAADGTFDIVNSASPLQASSPNTAIHTGYHVTNLVTLIARGSQIYLYINRQFIVNVTDTSTSCGQIGVMSVDFGSSADVAFSNAEVWTF